MVETGTARTAQAERPSQSMLFSAMYSPVSAADLNARMLSAIHCVLTSCLGKTRRTLAGSLLISYLTAAEISAWAERRCVKTVDH